MLRSARADARNPTSSVELGIVARASSPVKALLGPAGIEDFRPSTDGDVRATNSCSAASRICAWRQDSWLLNRICAWIAFAPRRSRARKCPERAVPIGLAHPAADLRRVARTEACTRTRDALLFPGTPVPGLAPTFVSNTHRFCRGARFLGLVVQGSRGGALLRQSDKQMDTYGCRLNYAFFVSLAAFGSAGAEFVWPALFWRFFLSLAQRLASESGWAARYLATRALEWSASSACK